MKYFDGHNDVLLKFYFEKNKDSAKEFFNGNDFCHIDFPKILKSNFCGGFFAIFVPNEEPDDDFFKRMINETYDFPLPNKIDQTYAKNATNEMISILNNIILQSNNKIKLCTSGKEINECILDNKIAIILHIEGAEAIDKDFKNLYELYNKGLRSIGLVWSRNNIFANGVPFSYPSSPDRGEGLTDLGKDLVQICDEKHILIDLSHLNQKGFYDVAKISKQPLMATHSNAHFITNHSRNLTNEQLTTIKDSQGIVGINFATAFLRRDGRMIPETSLDVIVEHCDHLLKFLGEDHVAIGSDYDGAVVPDEISDLSKIENLYKYFIGKGYSNTLTEKIFYKNWNNFLQKNLI